MADEANPQVAAPAGEGQTAPTDAPAPDGEVFDSSSSPVHVYDSFDDMGLDANLLRGVYSYGFEKPSVIQSRAIYPFSQGGDLIAQAQSGTGKTGAFVIGTLSRIDWSSRDCQALILSPTRELALQTELVCRNIGRHLPGEDNQNFTHATVGGTKIPEDLRRFREGGVVVAIGTPGRVFDMIKRGVLKTDKLKVIVLDEADDLLGYGFQEQIHEICRFLPQTVQMALFSATMPTDVLELSGKFLRDPTRVLMKKDQLTLDGIKQFYIALDEEAKLGALIDLYGAVTVAQSVIFCNYRRKVDWLVEQLEAQKFTVSAIHAEMKREEREKVMAQFKAGRSRVLISTDLLARGIDVQHVSIVMNFDIPTSKENYLHRIGRSGRYGRKGIAINFTTGADAPLIKELESFYHTKIEELPMDFSKYLS